jgi:hypothetical protein
MKPTSEMTLYLRTDGPVCYAVSLFETDQLEMLVQQLLQSGLSWCWESRGSTTSTTTQERPWTKLLPNNTTEFLFDLRARDADAYGRYICLVSAIEHLNPEEVHEALLKFSMNQGPMQVVAVQLGDSPVEHVFVSKEPTESARRLIESWGIASAKVTKTLPYSNLRLATIEALYELRTPQGKAVPD